MKEETKNEMDLLLRRLGRREQTSLSEATGSHLDADELSAYAENALPAAARSRYTAHLAECSRCRELVVQLSSAVGVIVATDDVAKPSAWRTFLASLFTPMVLRYAAPALGLIVVAAIAFVVLRREQQSAKFVTQVTNNEQRQTALQPTRPDSTTFLNDGRAKTEASPEQHADKQAKNQPPARTAPPPNAPPAVSSVEADVAKEKAEQPKPEEQTAAANEPQPPKTEPKSEPAPTPEVSQKPADAEVTKKEVRGVATAAAPAADREYRAGRNRDDKDSFARAPQNKVAGAASGAKLMGGGNTRSVAGRDFQKKGGVWIDTAYDSSKETVTLTRGSEQYRALVADEPAIKTIADELGGEIIVVWKGHTYRIR